MPKSNKRKNTTIQCQHCGKQRRMSSFFAFSDLPSSDGKHQAIPFKLSRFLNLIGGDTMVKLPKFYAGVCSECMKTTYYRGRNRETTLEVVPT